MFGVGFACLVGLDRRLHEKALDFRVGVEFDRNHNYRVCFVGTMFLRYLALTPVLIVVVHQLPSVF